MNSTGLDSTTINALDPRGLSAIQRLAKNNDPAALRAAAQQFEALFLHMVLKSMREASPREGLFDSEQSKMYESLLDQQMAQVLSAKRGVGLADAMVRQMSRQGVAADAASSFVEGLPLAPERQRGFAADGVRAWGGRTPSTPAAPKIGAGETAPWRPQAAGEAAALPIPDPVRRFVSQMRPEAEAVERDTGLPAAWMIAQAALETGWGRSQPRGADGSPSHNLFGIKAGPGWSGAIVEANTVEFVGGVAQPRRERFRAYASYAESFADYARLIGGNPRYAAVLDANSPNEFALGLQRGGYATDPTYAGKLVRVIDTVLRQGDTSA